MKVENVLEMLGCDIDKVEEEINKLVIVERWVQLEMMGVCEDNDVMKVVLKDSLNTFLESTGREGLWLKGGGDEIK